MKTTLQTIGELLNFWAQATPASIAIVGPGRKPLNYRVYGEQARYVGKIFRSAGLGRDNRVAIVLPTGPEAAVCYTSVCSHATAAPLNPNYTFEEFCLYLKNLSADAVIAMRDGNSAVRAAASTLKIRVIDLIPDTSGPAGTFRLAAEATLLHGQSDYPTPNDLALVVQTSGTTARSKVIPLTQQNVVARAMRENAWYDIGPEDRVLCLNPLYHHSGLKQCVIEPLQSGGSSVAVAEFDLLDFPNKLKTYQPTWCTGSAAFFHEIARNAGSNAEILRRHNLRFFRSGSTRLSPSAAKLIEEAFGIPILNAYSSSEVGMMTSNPLPPAVRRSETVGIPIGTQIAILDDEGNELPPGKIGEVAARGPTVMGGYENELEANAHSFCNGWFRTGDMGSFDQDGYLSLEGRLKEVINRGGEKISPAEIDSVLEAHSSVIEAAAFGFPHPTLNELVVAAVVLANGRDLNEKDLKQHARSLLRSTKVPAKVFFVDQLPRNSNGKLQRIELRERFAPAQTQAKMD